MWLPLHTETALSQNGTTLSQNRETLSQNGKTLYQKWTHVEIIEGQTQVNVMKTSGIRRAKIVRNIHSGPPVYSRANVHYCNE